MRNIKGYDIFIKDIDCKLGCNEYLEVNWRLKVLIEFRCVNYNMDTN
jgi:hypothetical protein